MLSRLVLCRLRANIEASLLYDLCVFPDHVKITLVNRKFLEFKNKGWYDYNKIGIEYESLHIMDFSVCNAYKLMM